MAIWLFRSRSRRKRSHSGTHAGDDVGPLPRSQTAPDPSSGDTVPARQPSSKKQRTDRTEPNKLQRRARTYSFESGREDEIRIGRKRSTRGGPKRESAPPPTRVPGAGAGANPATSLGYGFASKRAHGAIAADGEKKEQRRNTTPYTYPYLTNDDAALERIPTLHASKRAGRQMSRKLSKRRKNSHDREREAELKALRDFTPVRPATDAWTAGRPMKKDSRRVKSGFSLVRHPWDKEQHPSDVSLPIPESIHSSLSSDSEQISFKVSAFDVLAPKPTLRYTIYPRWGPPYATSAPARTDSVKRKFSDRSQIPEATLRAHKRIDDLADDFNASDLREVMERDQRRRERKREREQQRMERKLAKTAEKQRREAENGRESPPNLERGVLGREAAALGLGLDETSAVVTSSKQRHSPTRDTRDTQGASPKQLGKRPATDFDGDDLYDDGEHERDSPLHTFHRVSSTPEPHTPEKKPKAANPRSQRTPQTEAQPSPLPQQAQAQAPTQAQAQTQTQVQAQAPKKQGLLTKGSLRSKKQRSKSPPLSDPEQSDASGTPHKTSKTSESSSRGPLSWTSIFRWTRFKIKRSSGPSSFSNTSRDSMATQPQQTTSVAIPPAVTFVPPVAPGRSTIPKRTRSRFREDLPELPLSPPDSRVQSPEHHHEAVPPVILEQDTPSPEAHSHLPTPTAPIPIPGARYDTPTNSDSMRETPHSWATRDGGEPSPEPTQSMSLGSIDSEGSWLSGRLRGGRMSQMRNRRDSLQRQAQPSIESSDATETAEHDHDRMEVDSATGIADDEYLNRVASHGSTNRDSGGSASAWGGAAAVRKSTGEPRPSSDEEDDDARWGAVPGGKQPMVVHAHTAERMKSREGLLNTLADDDADDGAAATAEAAADVHEHEIRSEAGEVVEEELLESPVSATSDGNEAAGLQRATSVNLGKGHARHISAGSAKLLDLSPRASTDGKRKSSEHRWPGAEVSPTLAE